MAPLSVRCSAQWAALSGCWSWRRGGTGALLEGTRCWGEIICEQIRPSLCTHRMKRHNYSRANQSAVNIVVILDKRKKDAWKTCADIVIQKGAIVLRRYSDLSTFLGSQTVPFPIIPITQWCWHWCHSPLEILSRCYCGDNISYNVWQCAV